MLNNISIFAALIAGVLMFFSPCIFPLLPVYFSVLEKDKHKYRNTLLFLLGISTAFVTLGFSFGYLSDFLYTEKVRKIAALIIIILGLNQLEIFKFNFLNRTKIVNIEKEYKRASIESFMLGLTFSLGWTPCVGPILASILALVGENGTALYGSVLLFNFVLGFAIPFIIFTAFYDSLGPKIKFIKNNLTLIKRISAIFIILIGLLLFFDQLELIVAYFNNM